MENLIIVVITRAALASAEWMLFVPEVFLP